MGIVRSASPFNRGILAVMSDTGRVVLMLRFHPLARRPDIRRFGRRWDVVLKVDGDEHVFGEGPRHEVEVSAGRHEVEVAFRATGIMVVAKALGIHYGRKSLMIDVPAGGEVALEYRGGVFWTLLGGVLRRRE